jgi:tetratricopeptide (TPR) repeat protein
MMIRMNCLVFALLVATSSVACSQEKTDAGTTKRNEFKKLFTEGTDLISRYLPLENGKVRDPRSPQARRDLANGIKKLEEAIALHPKSGPAHWFLGKGHQILGDSEHAYEAFKASWEIDQKNALVARDYMLTCLTLGRSSEGVEIAEQAIELKPKDPSFVANYALALLVNGQTDRAEMEVQRALKMDPEDQVTQDLKTTIDEVKSGKRNRPTKLGDL